MPPPVPPSVKLGRMTHGRPTSSRISRASSRVWTRRPRGALQADLLHACLNSSRSSALSITSALAPIILTPCRSQHAALMQVHADVQPGLAAQRRQHGIGLLDLDDLLDVSSVIGSMYVRSAISGSVMIVAGLELTSTTS